jgi:hypothetical protein
MVLRENSGMVALDRKLGFEVSRTDEPGEIELTIDLRSVTISGLDTEANDTQQQDKEEVLRVRGTR